RTYTVEPKKSLSDIWNFGLIGIANCDLSVYGPNGFLRMFKGNALALSRAQLDVQAKYGDGKSTGDITLIVANNSSRTAKVSILDKYSGTSVDYVIKPNTAASDPRSLHATYNWYDLVITVDTEPSLEYQLAGHVEDGKDSVSDPWIGAV